MERRRTGVLPHVPLASPSSAPGTAARRVLPVLAVLGASFPAGCDRGGEEHAAPADASAGTVLAVVHGVPLTDIDLRVASGAQGTASAHADAPAPVPLAVLVRDELARQTALALGLDADPDYRRELCEMKARLEAFQRERLAGMYFRAEIARSAVVDEAEARRYFEANRERIRTELHVRQILVRDEDVAERAAAELAAGKPFEEVAREQFPDVPAMERSPWDLGYLRWNQIPEPWRSVVYGLAAGGTSGVIRGPNRRFWIIQLVARRENPELTFEEVREPLLATLRDEARLAARPAIERRLLESASVEYPAVPSPAAGPGPATAAARPLTAP